MVTKPSSQNAIAAGPMPAAQATHWRFTQQVMKNSTTSLKPMARCSLPFSSERFMRGPREVAGAGRQPAPSAGGAASRTMRGSAGGSLVVHSGRPVDPAGLRAGTIRSLDLTSDRPGRTLPTGR